MIENEQYLIGTAVLLIAVGYCLLGYVIGKGWVSWKKKEVIQN